MREAVIQTNMFAPDPREALCMRADVMHTNSPCRMHAHGSKITIVLLAGAVAQGSCM